MHDPGQGLILKLAIQYVSEIVVYPVGGAMSELFNVPNDNQFRMRQIKMITSPDGDLFYISESKTGSSVVKVAYDHSLKKITETPIHSNKTTIVALQFAHDQPFSIENNFSLYALDGDNQFLTLTHEPMRHQEKHISAKYQISQKTIPALQQVCDRLEKVPWQSVSISNRSLTTQKMEQEPDLQRKMEALTTFNLNSNRAYKWGFLDYQAESSHQSLRQDCFCM